MTTAPTPHTADHGMLAEALARAAVHTPGGGEVLDAFGDRMELIVDGAKSDGRFALFVLVTPPMTGPPVHRHHREDEVFIVTEGRYEFLIGDERRTVGPGGVVFAPRGLTHCFRNVGETTTRMTVLTSPAGFEEFFREAAALFKRGRPDMETAAALLAKYGMDLVGPPLCEE